MWEKLLYSPKHITATVSHLYCGHLFWQKMKALYNSMVKSYLGLGSYKFITQLSSWYFHRLFNEVLYADAEVTD